MLAPPGNAVRGIERAVTPLAYHDGFLPPAVRNLLNATMTLMRHRVIGRMCDAI
jgi:hypothetical protein